MTKVYSSYKIIGGFGLLLGLNIVISYGTFKLLTSSKISKDNVDLIYDDSLLTLYTVVVGRNILFLILFATQCKFIIADNNGITFINPLIPFLRTTKKWSDYDYFILVQEASRYQTHEAVWLIKEEKLKGRFSSFYYSNYTDLKKQLKIKGHGGKHFGPFKQLFLLLRLKRIKTVNE